ncbi:hypothetical protein CHS0354_013668 [Potamilus streckersoni]|uniref:Macro domain-containing protein n=1 Tax=Potamilus streckersoni TaxID=2493646 RepID=A0AAE0SUU1_9BIVA|nr:hypothetical protein CHS0354_013668 [Potamilus streckersoni]
MDAERVCMRPHTIDKKEIQVCLYYECLDDDLHAVEFLNLTNGTEDTVGKLKLPGPVVVKDLKPPILKFLMKNEKHKQMFERNMSDINGIARWPSCVDMYLIIECTVKDEDKNSGVVLKDWSIKVADKVHSFAAGIEVAEFNTIQEAWDRVIMGLQARAVDNPEDVSVSLEKEKYNIMVAGPKAAVEKLKKTVLNIIAKVETQVELEKQKVTEKKPMKTYEMTLLIETQFKQDIEEKYHGLSFDLNLKDMRAIFVGQADVVQKAVVQMHEKLKSFVSISMPMSKAAKDLLFAKENTDYIMQKMKSQKVIGVWDVDGTEEVHMFARDKREVQEVIQLVRDCLVEKDIKLDDVMVKNVQEEQWSQLVQRILKKHKQKVVIETKMMRVFIVAMDDVFQGVFDEIKIYLEKYNIQGLFLALEPVKVKFIQTYKMEDIKTLEKRFENSHVKLSIIDYGEQKGIKINGTEDGCNAVKTELTKLAKIIITKEHVIVEKAGLRKLLQSSRGKSQLSSVELKYRCFLVMMDSGTSNSLHLEGVSGGNSSGSEEDTGQSDEKMDKCAASVNVERIKDSVVQGEFVTQRTFSAVLDGYTPLSSSDDMSASSSSDVSIVHGICRYTLPQSVVLEIVQGDITMETTDVIVNSVLSNLNLIQGQVSKAILTAGGSSIQQECQNKT